jgi:hypothetical protein
MAAAARKAWNEAMKATALTALPPAMQQRQTKRRSDRNKKRRQKARKVQRVNGGENDEFRTALWVDALEGVDPSAAAVDEDEEYDELDDLDDRKKKTARKRQRTKVGVLPKRFAPRSLGSILMEELSTYGAKDGVSGAFLAAVAVVPPHQQTPRRKFCPVTGLPARYIEPKSGIPYANMRALDQIHQRSPPWMTLGGSAAYMEASKAILDE